MCGHTLAHALGRRGCAPLLVLLALCVAAPVEAEERNASDEPAAELATGAARDTSPIFGIMADIGLPEVIGASLVFRPWPWLRAHLGSSCDVISFGVRGGVSWIPFRGWFRPSITLEGGHVFDGNANRIARPFGAESPALEHVGYSHASAHLGLELGRGDGLVFMLHGGMSFVWTRVHDLQQVLQDEMGDPSLTFDDPRLTVWAPSAKIGLVYYF